MQTGEKPPARPIFRRLATGLAVVCFIIAGLFVIIVPEEGWLGPGVCVFVGFVMATIAATGHWPARHSK